MCFLAMKKPGGLSAVPKGVFILLEMAEGLGVGSSLRWTGVISTLLISLTETKDGLLAGPLRTKTGSASFCTAWMVVITGAKSRLVLANGFSIEFASLTGITAGSLRATRSIIRTMP